MGGSITHRILYRSVALFLCLALILPYFPHMADTVEAAEGTDYEAELAKRQAEYEKKFDMDTLTWATNGTDANGNIVNYGNTARNYLYWQDGSFGGVKYNNYIHVYAFEGDTICFGSDVWNSTLNEAGTAEATHEQMEDIQKRLGADATVDIVLTDLRGNRILYDVKQNGAGHIPNVQTEVLAKTMESPEGHSKDVDTQKYEYTPLTYKVTETGVYTFEFHSYDRSGNTGQTTKNHVDFYDDGNVNTHGGVVAAWDISVFNEQNHKETGRVYADYLSLQQNGNYNVVETYYVVTTDSYIYRWDWNGNRPNTYNFFADNKGLTDNATGSTLYKSVKELTNANFDYTRFGASFKYPGSVNTDESKSYYIFFEMPNSDLEGHLYSKAIQPDPAENIRFVDEITDPESGDTVPGAYEGMGGYFAFDTKEATTATLVLDFEQLKDKDKQPVVPGVGEKYAPVTISGPVKPYSTNYFYWDGRDGKGKVIPEGTYNIEDILTLTTKAGEIHFPVHDMESASGGFTFTRVSPIYDREGKQISDNGTNNILDATRNVIYYDDSAIYYGEHVGRTGLTEEGVRTSTTSDTQTLRDKFNGRVLSDGAGGTYFQYNNMLSNGSFGREYDIRTAVKAYVGGIVEKDSAVSNEKFIRIGDHSHITNMIEYYDEDGNFRTDVGDQAAKINYLNSAEHPVGISSGSDGASTTDYGITDFWTFIPAQAARILDTEETIQIINGNAFNLTGQVFYDKNSNGTYDSMADSDTLLSGVTLNLYKKTSDTSKQADKTYYTVGNDNMPANSSDIITMPREVVKKYVGDLETGKVYYELFRSHVTPVEGRYLFTNIPYTNGDNFVYEVVRPNSSYQLTSGKTQPKAHESATGSSAMPSSTGSYALYAYDEKAYGTEVQVIQVGGADGVDPDSKPTEEDTNHTITAVDVGYHYDVYTKLTLKKTWATAATEANLPEPAVYEVCYVDSRGESHVYAEEPQTKIENLEYSYELLPEAIDGNTVKDWYVAAEYYFAKVDSRTYLFKHTFDYATSSGTYTSFVGDSQYIELGDANKDKVIDQKDIPDANGDEVVDWNDLSVLGTNADNSETKLEWKVAGTSGETAEGVVNAPFHAVLDRNPGTAEITINITNADDPGVIEILKYTGALEDKNYLQGATFRVYGQIDDDEGDISIEAVEEHISNGNEEDLQWLADHQVASSSTRANGKVAFAGLDPDKHYVLREMFPPTGYRALDTLYMVHPQKDCTCTSIDELRSNSKPEGMSDEEWEELTRQNFYFGQGGTDDFVQTPIANAPISGDMAIRKQIDGRAWNNNDSFSFDIAFRNTTRGDLISVPDTLSADGVNLDGAVVINATEYSIVTGGGDGTEFRENLQKFVAAFNDSGKIDDVTVDNSCDPAKNIVTLVDGQEIEEILPDTKQSVPLVVNAEIKKNEDGTVNPTQDPPVDAQLNTTKINEGAPVPDPHIFPAAGTYTFTVSENTLEGGTLTSSPRVFTMVVKVTRERNPGVDEGASIDVNNSYLRAEVENIFYQDPTADNAEYPTNYGGRHVYAGVSPTFTNTYHVQPAIQTTSYAITKDFTGRLGTDGEALNDETLVDEQKKAVDGWLNSDHFRVTITGADETTQEALTAGNIYIGGLHGQRVNGTFETDKAIRFNQTNVTNPRGTTGEIVGDEVNKGHTFTFDEIDFQNLKFPVKWEFSDETKHPVGASVGDPVPETDENEHNVVVYLEDDNDKYLNAGNYFVVNPETASPGEYYPVVSRTEDIVYKLEIKEHKPNAAGDSKIYNGITYDNKVYTMVITLKNAPNGEQGNAVDGIVDELDFELYDCAESEITPEREPVATCETDQKVVTTFDDWATAEFDDRDYSSDISSDWTTKWYYVNNSNETPVIREATPVEWSEGDEGSRVPIKFEVDVEGTIHESGKIYIVAEDSNSGDNVYSFDDARANNLTFIAKREGHTDREGTSGHTMTFANKYAAKGTWTPTINKTLEGREWQDDETFDFELACTAWPGMGTGGGSDYTYNPLKDAEGNNAQVKTLQIGKGTDNTNSGSFTPITFTAPGEYEFTISETSKGSGLGSGSVTYDGKIDITVTATDDGNGNLELKVEGKGGIEPPEDVESTGDDTSNVNSTINFVNTYNEHGEFPLALSKLLTGRDWTGSDTFTFTITPDAATKNAIGVNESITVPTAWMPNSDGTYTVTVSNDTSGEKDAATGWETKTLNMDQLKIGNLGGVGADYSFTIQEKTDDFEGKQLYCAQPKIQLTIKVTPNMGDGEHDIVATYAYLAEDGTAGESVTSTGDMVLPFTNRYYVTAAPDGSGSSLTIGKTLEGRDWLADESYTAELTFDSESNTGDANNVQYAVGESASYSDLAESLTYHFKNESGGSNNPANWDLNFRFFEVGDYVFKVKETGATDNDLKKNVVCDETVYTVTYNVTKGEENRLQVSRSIEPDKTAEKPAGSSADIVFVNTYTPTPATWTPTIVKELGGRDWVTNDSFTFTLTQTAGEPDGVTMPDPAKVEITNDTADHKASLGDVTFTKAGEYTFTITETAPGNGIESTGNYTINAVVTDDPDNGKLSLALTPDGSETPIGSTTVDQHTTTTTTFENTYSQESGSFRLEIEKTLQGRSWKEGENFSFTVTPDENAKTAINEGNLSIPSDTWGDPDSASGAYTVKVDSPDSGETVVKSLGTVEVKEAGTYVFTIRETDDATDDTYCPEPEIVLTVNAAPVTQDGVPIGDMQVVTTYAYSGGSRGGIDTDGTTTVPFVNYAYAETGFSLNKTLTGRDWTDGEFNAEVELTKVELTGEGEDTSGRVTYRGVPLDVEDAVTVALKKDGGSDVSFRFLAAGTYTFLVEEVHGGAPGVTYDTTQYTVTVTVTADTAGVLAASTPAITKDTESIEGISITFSNTYENIPVTGGLTVSKTVVADNPAESGPFNFTVTLTGEGAEAVDGEYGGMKFIDGVAKFGLSHNGAVTAVNLPAGLRYTVAEAEANTGDYTTTSTGASGVIPEAGTVTAHFTNTAEGAEPPSEDSGGLTVSVLVGGSAGDQNKEWNFTVTLNEGPSKSVYSGGDFRNGVATFKLIHGQSATFTGLPAGATYTVTEAEAGEDGYATSSSQETGSIPGGGGIAAALFVNTKERGPSGNLTVTKTVAGTAGEQDRNWNFTVTLQDAENKPVTGTYNGAEFDAEGKNTFTLKHHETRTFTGLPAGVTYTVKETEVDDYVTTSIGATGEIVENETAAAVFSNVKNEPPAAAGNGFLTVTKTVTGNAGDHEKDFGFTVVLSDEEFDGEHGGVTFTSGEARFTLKDGESRSFELPADTVYTVTEDDVGLEGYTTITSDNTIGRVTANQTAVVSFINDRMIPVGNLEVAKTVTGAQGDREREWSFRVELGRQLSGHYGDMTFENGVAEFKLKHGDRVRATDLPAEISYTVTEAEANTGRYTTVAVGDTGLIPANDTTVAEYLNEWYPPRTVVTPTPTPSEEPSDTPTPTPSEDDPDDPDDPTPTPGGSAGTPTPKPSGGDSGTTHHTLPDDDDTPRVHRTATDAGISSDDPSTLSRSASALVDAASSKDANASSTSKRSDVPGTGDESRTELWMSLMLLAAGAAVLTFLRTARRRKKQ